MKSKRILVSGETVFINRYRALFEAIDLQVEQLSYLYNDKVFKISLLNKLAKAPSKLISILSPQHADSSRSTAKGFIERSRRAERRIGKLKEKPDFVLQLFGMYSPFWDDLTIPYAMYLDYTAALAQRGLPHTQQELSEWNSCERLMYERACHLFPMSQLVKSSLIHDYGISPDKITVVGSFANHHSLYTGEKEFGTKKILFNGSDFQRKGGDLVLESFEQIRKVMPEATLFFLGKKLEHPPDGVINPGNINSLEEMRQLFLEADLVLSPARCDPFPSFVIEGMNYGVPAIVSGNDGMPEIVDDGINGLVVNPLTSESIAQKVIDLLGSPSTLTSMSHEARKKVNTHLNYDVVANKIIRVLSAYNLVG
jgi:glycogen synthase